MDITDAVTTAAKTLRPGEEILLSVLCDNSRDPETIPSSLNDFHRFGGLYRNVKLVYVPSLSLERVHIVVDASKSPSAQVALKAMLHNPKRSRDEVQLMIRVFDCV